MTHKLMIKVHNKTGLKYLCYTQSTGVYYDSYKGSGKHWKKHLKKHGDDISTTLIFESNDYTEFKKYAIEKSVEFDIVNSYEWANLKPEDGTGGDTVSNKKWITNGSSDVYINKDDPLPEGWRYGRSNCVFKDPSKQREFASKVDIEFRGSKIKEAWDSGKMDVRDHSKCGSSGDDNPAKRPEVREKIRIAALKDSANRAERMSKLRKNGTIIKKKKSDG